MPNIKRLLPVVLASVLVLLAACDIEESRPDPAPIQNILPAGGRLIEWNPTTAQLNIEEVKAGLEAESGEVFTKSMDWYATESDLGFEYLKGKTAKQVVDMINCLKEAPPDGQKGCVQ